MQYHRLANLFPLLEGDEHRALVEDIRENGQREPIWTYEGAILDGRNRYRACIELGMEPASREWDGKGSIVHFVLSLNLHRRHLTASQRAVIALDILPELEAEAKERQLATLKQNAADTEFFPQRAQRAEAREQVASVMSVNPHYVSDAKHIQQEAPELIDSVRCGILTIPEAKLLAKAAPHVSHNSGNNEWYTPEPYIAAARAVMGVIDLDPASCEFANQTVQATTYYTAEDSGLDKPWAGRVWMNPPYSGDLIGQFCDRLSAFYGPGGVTEAIVLVNNATETAWFGTLIDQASAVVFPSSRVRFVSPNGASAAPLQGQAVIYLGANPQGFLREFRSFGWGAFL